MQLKILLDSIIHEEYFFSKAAGKPSDNSTVVHSYSFEINTGKSKIIESVLVDQLREKFHL